MSDQLGIVNKPPYFDDFDSSKNYAKILFRPGRAIQSRELTQIQSTIQSQIASLGDKLLPSSIVSGGDFQVATVKYLKFFSSTDVSYLKNKLAIVGNSSFKILEVKELNDPAFSSFYNYAIFFEYKTGSEISVNPLPFLNQTITATIVDEEEQEQTEFVFDLRGITDYAQLSEADKNSATGLAIYGNALLARLGKGIFYKKGFFIVSDESLILPVSTNSITSGEDTYTNYAPFLQNTRIAIKLSTEYITSEDDPTLYDPSAGYYNFAAPGADRLKITPSLVQSTGETNDDLIELIDIINGSTRVVDPIVKTPPTSIGVFATPTSQDCGPDRILKPFILDIIGTTLNINSGRAIVNCTDIEVVENKTVSLVKPSDNKRLYNQAFNDQCLSDAIVVQANFDNPLFGGVAGNDFASVNTNYFGSGKIRKLFSDEAVRLELVNCDGIKIGCLTLLDIEKNDSSSYRLYYNELQSYTSSIAVTSLFSETCTLSLDGEKVFTVESSIPLTCSDTTPGGNQRLVYKVPKGTNIKTVFDADYMITRDFIGDIKTGTVTFTQTGSLPVSAVIAEFDMDIPGGVFNDNNYPTVNENLFVVSVNGKELTLKSGQEATPHLRINASKTKMTLVLSATDYEPKAEDGTPLTMPTAGKCYLITKVRFPESESLTGLPIQHRKKRLKEARGSYLQNLFTNRTINLGFSDVYRLKSIKDSAGNDITSNFIFDDGQRNDRYDHASVTLLSGLTAENTDKEYVVEFRYFEHEPIAPGFYGPVTVNSYGFDSSGNPISGFHGLDLSGNQMTLRYDEIPNFLDRISGEVISLSDAVDFRMIRTEEGLIENGVNKSSIVRGRWFPSPQASAAVEAAYKLDLPRIDLLVLREDGSFVLLQGEPATAPVPPEYPKDGCVIAEINVPGTVVSSEDFIVQKPPIKAISLPELNDMQSRLAELEKALSIQTLENKARVQSSVLRNEFLTGMIVDDFGGHYVGDVSNDEYNCSMDFSKGTLRAPFTTKFFDFIPDTGYPTGTSGLTSDSNYYITAIEIAGGVTFLHNDQGTSEVSVNSFGSTDWHGYLYTDRPYQLWLDQTTKPVVRNNLRGQNDAWESGGEAVQPNGRSKGFGTQWGFWKSLWFGETLLGNSLFEKDRASAKAFADDITSTAPARFVRNVNKEALFAPTRRTIGNGGFGLTDSKTNRYVDSSLSFFSPENYIIVRGSSLKPSTTFSAYFENMNTPVSQTRLFSISGSQLTELRSDSSGNIEFVMYIPNGSYITGNKVIKIVENTTSTKKSFASCIYSNIGSDWKDIAETDDNTVELEFLPLGKTDVLLKNEKTLYASETIGTGIYQKFFVDNTEHPKGIILDKIGVYFSQIDSSIPVSIEIRRVDGGKVDSHRIIRNSRIEKTLSSVGYATFDFTKPVYLAAGEYALYIRSNSAFYKVHVSERGLARVDENVSAISEDVFATSIFGTSGFYGGSSFSQLEDQATTLRFYINRKKFNTSVPKEKYAFVRKVGLPFATDTTTQSEFDLFYFANNNWRTTTGNVLYYLVVDGEEVQISSNTDVSDIKSTNVFDASNDKIKIIVSTTRDDISPIVDTRKVGLLTVKNRISKTVDILQTGTEASNFGGSVGSLMKYITRRTDLSIPANVLRATVDVLAPSGFDVRMYAKVLYEGNLDFDNQPYTEMTRIIGTSSTSRDQFKENVFELDATSSPNNFISFAVKIIITANKEPSPNSVLFYPELRNLSVVSSVR